MINRPLPETTTPRSTTSIMTILAGYYGDSGYSFFGYATQPPYPGNFSQSIKMYVNANWPVALYGGPGVWIDESPGHPPGNYGAEHNFRLTPTGTPVGISADGQGSPFVTITTSGWYNFQMTFQKGALPTDLVTTNMNVFDSNGTLIGTTTVLSNSPGGPLYSQDLQGPGYVWITVWPTAGRGMCWALTMSARTFSNRLLPTFTRARILIRALFIRDRSVDGRS